LPPAGAGVNRNACVHFAHVRFAHMLLATIALLLLPPAGAGVNRNACVHFAHVRFAHMLLVRAWSNA